MSGIDVEPEARGCANEAPRVDNRIGLGDDPRQIGNFDGEASRFEIGGEDRPPSAAAELELDLPGRGEFHYALLEFAGDRGDRNGNDDLPSRCRLDPLARLARPDPHPPPPRYPAHPSD